MYLKNLTLANFKNYEEAGFAFNENVNGIVGKNGSGKTNLLDAIHYLSFCKSYFSSQDVYSVRFNADFFAVHGDFYDRNTENSTHVSCVYKNGHKSMRANRKEYSRLSAHIGLFPVVMVSPYDSDIINGGSENRRKFFDVIISQYDREYLQHLISYRKLLAQRNALLKQMADSRQYDNALLEVIDGQMELSGPFIYGARRDFIAKIRPIFSSHYQRLSHSAEEVDLQYLSALNEKTFADGLRECVAADFKSGFTNFGVHKDDFAFLLGGQPVKRYGSQGQQKSFSLALRLAQFDYSYEQKNIKPILLLDDIFDKLDMARTAELLNMVGQEHFGQVFLTDTDENRVKRILSEHGISHQIITTAPM
jgi:DNA replication and repair protein RecF